MLFNLTDVFTSDNLKVERSAEYEANEYVFDQETYSILQKKPVNFTFTNIGKGRARIEGNTSFEFLMHCDRCLQDVKRELPLSFTYEVFSPETEMTDEQREEQSFMDGFKFNADELINNEILMKWPMKVLCKDDCKGICPVCGKNLNEGVCGCDSFVPDPRMAKIKDIFNANKEV